METADTGRKHRGKVLKKIRLLQNKTQNEYAKELKLSAQTLSLLECGLEGNKGVLWKAFLFFKENCPKKKDLECDTLEEGQQGFIYCNIGNCPRLQK